jgi:hypothetical protein
VADSIREALTQAFAAEDKEVPTPAPAAVAAPVVEPAPAVEPAVTEPTDAVIGKPGVDVGKVTPVVAPAPDKAVTAVTPAVVAPIPPPASWKAAEKVFWDKIPPEARAAVMRREQETQRALSTSADARKLQQNFAATMAPFEPLLQAYGVKDPLTAILPLMQTRAALEVGTPEQKAQLIANLVYQFGIDITKLDGYLVNGPQQQVPTPQPIDPHSIPELAPLFQIAEQFKSAQAAKVDAAIEEVSALPHFEELREEMADILDLAAQRGRSLTIKEAYDHAARLAGVAPSVPAAATPDVSQAAAILARSRRAASSVAGAPKGSTGAKPTSLRDTIAAAMEG